MTVATKDDFQDLTAEETTTYFIQSNISSGEELKSYNGLLEGKEYYIYRSDPLQSSVVHWNKIQNIWLVNVLLDIKDSQTQFQIAINSTETISLSSTTSYREKKPAETTEDHLSEFPRDFGLCLIACASVLTVLTLICIIKQFCCKKVTKNYAYRKLS